MSANSPLFALDLVGDKQLFPINLFLAFCQALELTFEFSTPDNDLFGTCAILRHQHTPRFRAYFVHDGSKTFYWLSEVIFKERRLNFPAPPAPARTAPRAWVAWLRSGAQQT